MEREEAGGENFLRESGFHSQQARLEVSTTQERDSSTSPYCNRDFFFKECVLLDMKSCEPQRIAFGPLEDKMRRGGRGKVLTPPALL